ncbi:MAG: hypothetical protein EA339_06695 [Rhodobacteraceae bacterium]|nr:MAG: hypothetical protein EA339_06695 [Paracoccaceae bacterium]
MRKENEMYMSNSADTFIRLLTEAYETDRMSRNAKLSAQQKAQVVKFKKMQLTALHRLRDAMEPLDCIQLAVTETRDKRLN